MPIKQENSKKPQHSLWPLSETLPDMVRFHQRLDAFKSTIANDIILLLEAKCDIQERVQ